MSRIAKLRPNRLFVILCFWFLLSLPVLAAPALKPLPRITGEYEAYTFAQKLVSPDGLAVHPKTGEIYVAEEDAAHISVIRNGKAHVVVNGGWKVQNNVPAWAITKNRPLSTWLDNELHSPEGIAFSREGHLWVTEDVPDGRLLEFIPDSKGRFKTAQVHPIPWMNKPFSWEGITIAEDGRLFLAGAVMNEGTGLLFGTVLMRDTEKDWWIVDYGPFASFSSVALSRDDNVLVVGDELLGGVNWWDTVRHLDIGMVSNMTKNIEGVCVLPDGAIAAVQEYTVKEDKGSKKLKGGTLIRIDPRDGSKRVVAEGFDAIESVVIHPETGNLYISEDGTGSIIELRPKFSSNTETYLLERSIKQFEYSQRMTPTKWPHFLRRFVDKMGIRTTDEKAEGDGTEESEKFLTMQEFAEHVPLIAGKINAIPEDQQSDDPVEQVKFVSFFPNQTMRINKMPTPSLSLFAAKYKSGKILRTQVLTNFVAVTRSAGKWSKGRPAMMFVPLTVNSAKTRSTGVDVSVSFLGLGRFPDYHLTLSTGVENTGNIVVEGGEGFQAGYTADFMEILDDGTEVSNLIIAGFDEVGEAGSSGWVKIGKWPVGAALSTETVFRWTTRNMKYTGLAKKVEDMEKREQEALNNKGLAKPKEKKKDQDYSESPEEKKKRKMAEEKEDEMVTTPEEKVEKVAYDWGRLMKSKAVQTWQSDIF